MKTLKNARSASSAVAPAANTSTIKERRVEVAVPTSKVPDFNVVGLAVVVVVFSTAPPPDPTFDAVEISLVTTFDAVEVAAPTYKEWYLLFFYPYFEPYIHHLPYTSPQL
jgi:hypothetical protein